MYTEVVGWFLSAHGLHILDSAKAILMIIFIGFVMVIKKKVCCICKAF